MSAMTARESLVAMGFTPDTLAVPVACCYRRYPFEVWLEPTDVRVYCHGGHITAQGCETVGDLWELVRIVTGDNLPALTTFDYVTPLTE